MAKYNISGYIFTDEISAKKAAKELKAVEYILGQLKSADEEGVLKVYKKLLDQRLFSTEIGMSFLNQLRQNLLASEVFSESDIPPIYSLDDLKPVTQDIPPQVEAAASTEKNEKADKAKKPTAEDKGPPKKQTKQKKQKAEKSKKESKDSDSVEVKRLRLVNKLLLLAVFTLLLIVGGMFYVSTTINSPTILNYKETITDEYASWKEQLEAKEKELDAREAELSRREAGGQ